MAMDNVKRLCEKLKAPMLYTMRAKEFAEVDNSYEVGMIGHLGWDSAKFALDNCDCFLMLGTDFPFSQMLPQDKTILQIDICATHLGRRSRLDFGLVSDVDICLQELLPLIDNKGDQSHLLTSINYAHEINIKMNLELEQMENLYPIRPEYLTSQINKYAKDDAIFLVDVGLNDIWAARYLRSSKNRIIFGSYKHGTLAAAIGEAIGASFAEPNRQIVVLSGDGGLTDRKSTRLNSSHIQK